MYPEAVTIEDIFSFLKTYACSNLHADTDLVADCGITGDDWDELIFDFSEKFSVDLSGYIWYFHAEDEAAFNNPGGWFFKPPYKRVHRIPVTPNLLLHVANTKTWDVRYPPHKLPRYRWDVVITTVICFTLLFFSIRSCF